VPIFAGSSAALTLLRELVVWPGRHGELAASLGVRWPRGVLLHGPPGCGKSLVVRTVAAEAGAPCHTVGAADVFGAFAGESERRLRDAFAAAAAAAVASAPTPALLFLDELDALCPRRAPGKEHEARVTAQLLVLMDGGGGALPKGATLLVIGATNRPDAIDPALRRPGRFEREVELPVPEAASRAAILARHACRLPLAPGVNLADIAAGCFGYSGADLAGAWRCCADAARR